MQLKPPKSTPSLNLKIAQGEFPAEELAFGFGCVGHQLSLSVLHPSAIYQSLCSARFGQLHLSSLTFRVHDPNHSSRPPSPILASYHRARLKSSQ